MEALTEKDESRALRFSVADALAKRILTKQLPRLEQGRITVMEAGVLVGTFGEAGDTVLDAVVHVHDPVFYRRFLFGGDIGAVEAYMQGAWDTDDFFTLIRILARNAHLYDGIGRGWGWLTRPVYMILNYMRSNTRRGSQKNIHDHYDLGNDFFQTFLDETLCYSCGVFENEEATLYQASEAKMKRLCDLLELSPDDRLLEIGSGWGGFAVYAASHYGCNVVTTTISKAQYEYTRQRVAEHGLSDKVTVLLSDYRDLTGEYDKIVSIEMIEAVGHRFLPAYFEKCAALLSEKGKMALQAITIRDQEFDTYKNGVDFIKRFIFPGGCLPSLTAICDVTTQRTDLRLAYVNDIGRHYVKTLQMWRQRFMDRLPQIRSLGYEEPFLRLWDCYFLACAAAFAEGKISNLQIVLAKPAAFRLP